MTRDGANGALYRLGTGLVTDQAAVPKGGVGHCRSDQLDETPQFDYALEMVRLVPIS